MLSHLQITSTWLPIPFANSTWGWVWGGIWEMVSFELQGLIHQIHLAPAAFEPTSILWLGVKANAPTVTWSRNARDPCRLTPRSGLTPLPEGPPRGRHVHDSIRPSDFVTLGLNIQIWHDAQPTVSCKSDIAWFATATLPEHTQAKHVIIFTRINTT